MYNSGRGYVLKIHDNMTQRFRHSHPVTLGTVKKDTLCLDASEKLIAVGGLVSQKVHDISLASHKRYKCSTARVSVGALWNDDYNVIVICT